MSDEKQETRADIVREMRNLGKLDERSTDKIPRSLMGLGLRTYADRLEAAEKRERGNAAAMREALLVIKNVAEIEMRRHVAMSETDDTSIRAWSNLFVSLASQALSAPNRNCDVLSADQCKDMWECEMRIYMPKEATDIDRHNARIVAYGVIDALFSEQKGCEEWEIILQKS